MRLGAVLMASGAAKRFGENKLLYPVDGVPVIERAFSALPAVLFDRASVVSCYPEILAMAVERGYEAIPNHRSGEGQSASIRLGLAPLQDMDGVLFGVCDQPWLTRRSVVRVLEAFSRAPDKICSLSWQGRRGSPVIFPRALYPELMELSGDEGGRTVIRANGRLLEPVEADGPWELRDVDTPLDLTRMQ